MVVYVVGWYDYDERKSADRIQDRQYFASFEDAMAVVREQVRTWLCMWGTMDYTDLKKMDDTALRAVIDATFSNNNVPWTEADVPVTNTDVRWAKYREYLVDDNGDEMGFITKVE